MEAGNSRNGLKVLAAAFVAAVLSTCAQWVLWQLSGENAWALLVRDSRLTAALVLGKEVLPPSMHFDVAVLLVASGIHFGLSALYAWMLFPLRHVQRGAAIMIGVGFGLALYLINLHGFTLLFPWFSEARGSITLVAHIVFGCAVMMTYQMRREATCGWQERSS